jgi:arsenate reductase
MRVGPFNVLFLCTGNSVRSILAEAYLNAAAQGRFKAYSAGSHPTGTVNPLALELLQAHRLDTTALRSKSWDEFAQAGAPQMDLIFTVCDNAAGETCPVWPGRPVSAHWGVADPAATMGTGDERRRAFSRAFGELSGRIDQLLRLPVEKLDCATLVQRLREIGRTRA